MLYLIKVDPILDKAAKKTFRIQCIIFEQSSSKIDGQASNQRMQCIVSDTRFSYVKLHSYKCKEGSVLFLSQVFFQ